MPPQLPQFFWVIVYILLAFAVLFLLHYLRIIVRFVCKVGLAQYIRWTLFPDIRAWFVGFGLCLHVLIVANAESFNWFAAFVAPLSVLVALLRGLCPPQILLLHTFDPRNAPVARWLVRIAPLASIVSLFPGQIENRKLSDQMQYLMLGIGARYSTDTHWRDMVLRYMEWADVVVVNLSHARAGLFEELAFLAERQHVLDKTVFIGGEDSPPEVVKVFLVVDVI